MSLSFLVGLKWGLAIYVLSLVRVREYTASNIIFWQNSNIHMLLINFVPFTWGPKDATNLECSFAAPAENVRDNFHMIFSVLCISQGNQDNNL